MSRIGKMPIQVPSAVKVQISGPNVAVEGPLGKLDLDVSDHVSVAMNGDTVTVTRRDDSKQSRARHGLYRNLINNMVTGVSTGFTRSLLINGVGYRAEVNGKTLVLNVGYSHPVDFAIPEGVKIEVADGNKVAVSGADKQVVGHVAARIRATRPPEPYKGKGIRYEDERIRRKEGKTGVA